VILENKHILILSIFLVILGSVNGCVTSSNQKSTHNIYEETRVHAPQKSLQKPPTPVEGSLWTDNGNDQFFLDLRAKRVGDTVTVDIVENTSSSIDANTKAGRSSEIDARIDNMATFMRTVENKSDRLGKDRDGTFSGNLFKATMANEFDGQGTSDRSGKVTASIGAIVTDVLPNGNLVLHGRREMKVNNEIQYISVSGIARPRDIGTDNRIKSIFLANSRIEYAGKGVIADKQRPGWATRILDNIWPF
jgi:flagellar L-ring protein precursor FlgH